MKADYVVRSGGFGEGRIPVEAEQQLADVSGVESVSGVRTGAADVDGSVTQVNSVDPQNVNSVFDLNPSSGSIADLGDDGVAVQESTDFKLGDKVPVKFPSTGRKVFTVARGVQAGRSVQLHHQSGRVRGELSRPARRPDLREDRGGRVGGEHEGVAGRRQAVPGDQARDTLPSSRSHRLRP